MNLILVGYRGSGKSVVGAILATRLRWQFVDLDEIITHQAGMTIAEIFSIEGEEGFRRRELAAYKSTSKLKNCVIALGGGAVTVPEIQTHLRRLDKVVWLRAPAAILWGRINQDVNNKANRPNLTSQGGLAEVEEVLRKRDPLYRSVANHWVDTFPDTPEQVADTIQTWFQANDSTRRYPSSKDLPSR